MVYPVSDKNHLKNLWLSSDYIVSVPETFEVVFYLDLVHNPLQYHMELDWLIQEQKYSMLDLYIRQ